MTALNDRRLWLVHLHECTRCPTDLCDKGLELHAAVVASLAPGESWQGVWAPPSDEEEIINLAIYRGFGGPHDHPGRAPWS